VADHLDLRLLSQFLDISRAPTMAAAARKMGLSTSAVSQIVHRLERDLRTALFERSSQGMRLTPAGVVLQEQAQSLLQSEAEMLHELKAYQSQLLPKLRIYVMESVAKYVMPAIVSELRPIVPQLEILSGRSMAYTQEFLRGDFDVLLSSETLDSVPRLDRFSVCSEELIGLAPAGVDRERLNLHALAKDLPFIRLGHGSRMDQLIQNYLAKQGLDPPRAIECSSAAPILELVDQGIGWTISSPLSIAYFRPDAARIEHFALPGRSPRRDIWLIVNSGRLLDVPDLIARSSRRSIKQHLATWPEHLTSAISFPDEIVD
jgi:DNA-binding transcriptional LysR family regulator